MSESDIAVGKFGRQTPGNSKCPTWCVWVLPILGVIIVICLVLLIVRLVNNRKLKPNHSPGSVQQQQLSQPSQFARPPNLDVPSYPVRQQPSSYSEAYNSTKEVISLDEAKARDVLLSQGRSGVVAFVATWCGHCKALIPAFKKAATMSKLQFFMLEHSQAGKLTQEFGITGYPTVIRFEQGVPVEEYKGDRSAESLAAFGNK